MISRSITRAGVSSSEMCMTHYSMRTDRTESWAGYLCKLPGIHPGLLDHSPPVDRQVLRHIFIREPAVSLHSPAGPPGVAHQQRARVRADDEMIVVAHRCVGVPALQLAGGRRKWHFAIRTRIHV